MNDFTELAKQVKLFGLVKRENWLDVSDQKKIEKIILSIKPKKGSKKSWLSIGFKSHLIKLLKLDIKNLIRSFFFINLSKKLKLNDLANNIFQSESELIGIDFYYNVKSNEPVLDWHCDTAYSGAKVVKDFISPEDYSIKFFFYLTDVSKDNGCVSYIPYSNRITHSLKKGLFDGDIKYSPYWSLKDYKNTILVEENYNYIKNDVGKKILDNFINTATLILNKKGNIYDYDSEVKKGGAIIFDETGIHRGSKTSKNDRIALRFFYKKK